MKKALALGLLLATTLIQAEEASYTPETSHTKEFKDNMLKTARDSYQAAEKKLMEARKAGSETVEGLEAAFEVAKENYKNALSAALEKAKEEYERASEAAQDANDTVADNTKTAYETLKTEFNGLFA